MKAYFAFFLILSQLNPVLAAPGAKVRGCFGPDGFVIATATNLSPRSYLGVQDLEDVVKWMNRDFGPGIESRINFEGMSFNAGAELDGSLKVVTLNLGLILHPKISKDVIALIGCHEIGHHLAGAPMSARSFQFSVEGQADFFAPQECFHRWLRAKVLSAYSIRPEVQKYCSSVATRNTPRYENCNRVLEASVRLSEIFAEKRKVETLPDLFSLDQTSVTTTLEAHSSPQCRLDTFKAGYISHIWALKPRPNCWYRDDRVGLNN